MKRLLPALATTLFCVAASSLQAATLIQYNFDSPISNYVDSQLVNTSYADQSGNGRTVNFNRVVSQSANDPFATSHPSVANLDFGARTRYNAATAGSVTNLSGINLNTNKEFTMEGWVYLEGFTSISGSGVGGTIWSLSSSTGGTSLFALGYNSSGVVTAAFNARSQSDGTRNFTTSTTLSLNTWHHVAYVKTALDIRIYVDGVLVNTFSEVNITSRALPTALSSASIGGNIFGTFDDFRLSDVALTADQLGYHEPFTVIPEPGLSLTLIGAGLMGGFTLVQRRRARR